MKKIFVNTFENFFHICEIESLKYNVLNKTYYLCFYDCVDNVHSVTKLVKDGDEFYCTDIKYRNELGYVKTFEIDTLKDVPIDKLSLAIKSRDLEPNQEDVYINEVNSNATRLINKLEYLELVSYSDAINGPIYYYFIVNNNDINDDRRIYDLKLVGEYNTPQKKNIISRYTTPRHINDYVCYGKNLYYMSFSENDTQEYSMENEKILVEKIISLNNEKREIDTVLLTKMVRLMLASDDRIKATREYQDYLNNYYDRWMENKQSLLRK